MDCPWLGRTDALRRPPILISPRPGETLPVALPTVSHELVRFSETV